MACRWIRPPSVLANRMAPEEPVAYVLFLLFLLPGHQEDMRYKMAGFLCLDHSIGEYTMTHRGQVDLGDPELLRKDTPLLTLPELRLWIEREFLGTGS